MSYWKPDTTVAAIVERDGRFRNAIGEAGVEEMLKATIDSRPCKIQMTAHSPHARRGAGV